jgi:hypothetical protein
MPPPSGAGAPYSGRIVPTEGRGMSMTAFSRALTGAGPNPTDLARAHVT